ncbi:hypothetical protein BDZ94DRAFT_1248419 [Collybia nuda]|uniref:F-box domain-containing protein n=1 Tax=Collybia nuda TaxID=64659 RepID=A0A9P5YET0_9AGAR|nr:hypothetical protein BDZ94DRAFT_1248419 [Collybia nuda]
MAPLIALPPELISYIMSFIANGPVHFPITTEEPRLQLTWISSVWRKIAFSTAILWDLNSLPRIMLKVH